MGNLFGQTPQPPKVRYDVVLPTGCRSWEQLYCGDVNTWDSVAARYGMDKFAYTCGMQNCDREAVCLNYFRASVQTDKRTVSIHRYKRPSVHVPVNSSASLKTLLSKGFQLNQVIAAERGGLALLVVRRSLENMSQVAFPLVQLGLENMSQVAFPLVQLRGGSSSSSNTDKEDRKKESSRPRLLRRLSSRKEGGAGGSGQGHSESRKRPSSACLEDRPSRPVGEEEEGSGGVRDRDTGGVRCLGVLHAPRRDMTIISCQLSPDLSQTAVLFYSQSRDRAFCYTLHCYSNHSLQTRETPAHAQALTAALNKETSADRSDPDPVTPHLLRRVKLSRTVQPYFVYDPRYGASRIAVANYECREAGIVHELVLLSLEGGEEEKEKKEGEGGGEDGGGGVGMVKRGNLSLPSLFGNSRLNLLYSKDGELLIMQKLTDDRFGVTSFCDFYIFTSQTLFLVKYLTLSLPGLFHICKVSYEPVFSRCGSFMRVLDHRSTAAAAANNSSIGGGGGDDKDEEEEQIVVQVYQLPRIVSLMSQCRRVILQQMTSTRHVDRLPLPPKLKDYLQFRPLYY